MIQIKSKEQLFTWTSPIVMGVININDDSFYSGSRLTDEEEIVHRTKKMIEEGAAIIDMGAASSRPGSEPPTVKDEIQRVTMAVEACKKNIPNAVISVDTYRHEVADAAIQCGAMIINDISSGTLDPKIHEVVAKYDVAYIAMHMKGTPKTMQNNPQYDDLIFEINQYFLSLDEDLKSKGIYNWIVDPGFGFGKTIQHNYELLFNLEALRIINKPILVGISRKSMIYKLLDKKPEDVLPGTTALHWEALISGADILRVHDVKEAVQLTNLFQKTAGWR